MARSTRYGVRNPQRFSWDTKNGSMFVADIGQNLVEEISPVTAGANLGWNKWEGSYKYVNGRVDTANPRSEPGLTWPIVEYDHTTRCCSASPSPACIVYRDNAIPQLTEHADLRRQPERRDLLRRAPTSCPKRRTGRDPPHPASTTTAAKTLLQMIKEKNAQQGRPPATRADLRFGVGPDGQMFVLNKRDGVIRLLVPDGK